MEIRKIRKIRKIRTEIRERHVKIRDKEDKAR